MLNWGFITTEDGNQVCKAALIEASLWVFEKGDLSIIELIAFWISVWLDLDIPYADDGIAVYTLKADQNTAAEMQWGGTCMDYTFLGIPYNQLFGYIVFEDSNY